MNDTSPLHPDPEQLAAFRQARLGEPELTSIKAHLARCEACRARVGRQPLDPSATADLLARDETAGFPANHAEPAAGSILPNHPRYRITELLGHGGMGTVYKAEHLLMERPVALKVIKKSLTDDPSAVERFRREVKAAARLSHPNIVAAFDAEQFGETHFLVMEFVEGIDLGRLIAQRGPLPVREACDYARQSALGLEHARERGLVHRDIKPQNLMLTPGGQVKILDFGLAQLASAAAGSLTGLGTLMGTPDYIAPEQARDAHKADIRADIYSLGCTLYHLLAGRPPFDAEGPALQRVVAHLERTPPPLAGARGDLPPELVRVVERMMARDPARRYQTPGEAAEALAPFTSAAPARPAGRPPGKARRWLVSAALLLAVLGLAGYWLGPAVVRKFSRNEARPGFEGNEQTGPGGVFHFENANYEATVDANGSLTSLRAGGVEILAPEAGLAHGTYFWEEQHGGVAPLGAAERLAPGVLTARGDGVAIRYEFGPDNLTWTLTNSSDRVMKYYVIFSRAVIAVRSGEGRWAKVPAEKDWTDTTWFAGQARLTIAGSTRIWGPFMEGHQVWEARLQPREARRVVLTVDTPTAAEHAQAVAVKSRRELPDPQVRNFPSLALVTRPAPIREVRNWTLETRRLRAGVHTVAYSRDGRLLATAGWDGPIRLWEPGTGRLVRILMGHAALVRTLAWSPDGKTLASASWDYTIKLWDPESGRLLRTLRGHTGEVNAVAWSPNNKTLASCGSDNRVRLWDFTSGQLLDTFRGHTGNVWSVGWSADGKILASGSEDRSVRLWDADTGQMIKSWLSDTRPPLSEGDLSRTVFYLAWAPRGNILATCTGEMVARLWNTDSGKLLHTLEPAGYAAWSPDGKTLATGSQDTGVRLWDASSGKLSRTAQGQRGHLYGVAWSPDGKELASGSGDGSVHLWQAETAQFVRALPRGGQRVNKATWSPDGKTVACGMLGPPDQVPFWDLPAGLSGKALPRTFWVEWSPDGKSLAAFGPDQRVRLLQADTLQQRTVLRGPTPSVWKLIWSPDGKSIATASEDGTIRLWESAAGKLLKTLTGHTKKADGLAWSRDGKWLASSSEDNATRIWDTKEGICRHTLKGKEGRARGPSLAWSTDGTTLAIGSTWLGRFTVWDTASGTQIDTVRRHQGSVAVAWSRDGKTLLSVGEDNTVRFWDSRDGFLQRVVAGPAGFGVFSPGRRLLASPLANTLRVWESGTGQLLGTLVPVIEDRMVIVSPDGHFDGSPGVERQLLYAVETDRGQDLLSPEEFTRKYGWRNDPLRVRPHPPPKNKQ